MSREAARKAYGISDLASLKNNVENAVEHALEIHDAVNYLSSVTEACILEELGIHIDDPKSDSDEAELSECERSDSIEKDGCDDSDCRSDDQSSSNPRTSILDPDITKKETSLVSPAPANDHMLMMLRESSHNWFAFVEELKMLLYGYAPEVLNSLS